VAKPAAAAGALTQAQIQPQLDEYYQKAKASGEMKVTHYGIFSEYEPLAKVFMERYPGTSVEAVGLRGAEIIQRIGAEMASGKGVANVAGTGVTTTTEMERQGMYVKWRPPSADYLPAPEGGSDDRRWIFTVSMFGNLVNTSQVPPDKYPVKRQDLLDPFWKGKGKLFSGDPRQAGGGQSFWVIAAEDLGQPFLDGIKAQDITFTRDANAAPAQIARGEYAMVLATGVNQEILDLEASSPVKMTFFRDGGAHYTDITAGVITGAPGQDVGKLWISWLTSPEGQAAQVDKVKVYPVLAGIAPPGGWPSFEELKPSSRNETHRAKQNEYIAMFENTFFK
jgi:ABC-type Fe3+ transport system substrate-binding protein